MFNEEVHQQLAFFPHQRGSLYHNFQTTTIKRISMLPRARIVFILCYPLLALSWVPQTFRNARLRTIAKSTAPSLSLYANSTTSFPSFASDSPLEIIRTCDDVFYHPSGESAAALLPASVDQSVDEEKASAVNRARMLLLAASALYGTNFSLVKMMGESSVDIPVSFSTALRFAMAALATTLPCLIWQNHNHKQTTRTHTKNYWKPSSKTQKKMA